MERQSVSIRELDRSEIERILARNHVGRIAFLAEGGRVDIQPIGYVYADGWIFGRTSMGAKLESLHSNWWAAFEVDEVDGPLDWRSVVVHGGFYVLAPEGTPQEREQWKRALELLRGVMPEAFTEADPVPFRSVLFRMAVQEVSGRESRVG